ncbi:hypothetical protein HN51_054909 [Arachis hypogaea]
MAYCPLSLHRTGLQNNLSIFIDRVAGQRTKEGYHPRLEKPFFCSRFFYVGREREDQEFRKARKTGKRKASEERVIQLLTSAGFSWNEGLFGKRLLMRRCYIVKKETRAPFEETKFCPSPSHAPSHELLGWLRERKRRSPSRGKMNI